MRILIHCFIMLNIIYIHSAMAANCYHGYYLSQNYGCMRCLANYYCPGDDKDYECQYGTYSETGARTITDCIALSCDAGYYADKHSCVACGTAPANSHYTNECDYACDKGYKMQDGECIETNQSACENGVSELWVGTLSLPLYQECDSPALWIGTVGGKCCVNLAPGTSSGTIHINYNNQTYHTVN